MWLTAAELKLVIDGLGALARKLHSRTPRHKAAKTLQKEFEDKYTTVHLLDIEAAKR